MSKQTTQLSGSIVFYLLYQLFLLLSTSEARRQLYTLVRITPLPLFHKALLRRYQGPKISQIGGFLLLQYKGPKISQIGGFLLLQYKGPKISQIGGFLLLDSDAQQSPELYSRIARRQQRTAPFSEFRGGRPCLDQTGYDMTDMIRHKEILRRNYLTQPLLFEN